MSIDELEALAKAATPGWWKLDDPVVRCADGEIIAVAEGEADAAFIAAANPATVLALIQRLRAAEAMVAEMPRRRWFASIDNDLLFFETQDQARDCVTGCLDEARRTAQLQGEWDEVEGWTVGYMVTTDAVQEDAQAEWSDYGLAPATRTVRP